MNKRRRYQAKARRAGARYLHLIRRAAGWSVNNGPPDDPVKPLTFEMMQAVSDLIAAQCLPVNRIYLLPEGVIDDVGPADEKATP